VSTTSKQTEPSIAWLSCIVTAAADHVGPREHAVVVLHPGWEPIHIATYTSLSVARGQATRVGNEPGQPNSYVVTNDGRAYYIRSGDHILYTQPLTAAADTAKHPPATRRRPKES
jgi:hypothetical protein